MRFRQMRCALEWHAIRRATPAAEFATRWVYRAGDLAAGAGMHSVGSGLPQLHDTLIANNAPLLDPTDPADIFGQYVADYSLIENVGQGAVVMGTNNVIGLDAEIEPLADNGGPTLTHRIRVDSPAFNAGDPNFSGPATREQRGFGRVAFGRIDIGAFERDTPPEGDFNHDGVFDCRDIDGLVAAVAGDAYLIVFDMNMDQALDGRDVDLWLAAAGAANLPSGQPYLPGDANLDGVVDVSDLNLFLSHRFTATPAWCAGDFSADGIIDVTDFNIWNTHRFQTAALSPIVNTELAGAASSTARDTAKFRQLDASARHDDALPNDLRERLMAAISS